MLRSTFLDFKTEEPRKSQIKSYGTKNELRLMSKAASDMNLTVACLIRNAIGEYLIHHDLMR